MKTKANVKNVEIQQWRFYRSNLESIVWDKDKNRPLADFTGPSGKLLGHFTTDDPAVAEKLRSLGYPEIPLDAEEPPPDLMVRKPRILPNADDNFNVPIVRGQNEQLGQAKIEAFREETQTQAELEAPKAPKVKDNAPLPKRIKKTKK